MITPLAGRVRSGQTTATANINIMLHSTISTLNNALTFTHWISPTPHSTSPTITGYITSHCVSSDTAQCVGGHSVQWSSIHGLHIISYHSIGWNSQVRAGSGADFKKKVELP